MLESRTLRSERAGAGQGVLRVWSRTATRNPDNVLLSRDASETVVHASDEMARCASEEAHCKGARGAGGLNLKTGLECDPAHDVRP